jgi:hypothetical protein
MKSSVMIALCLATAACGTPKLPDPTFEFPNAPADLQQAPEQLKTIDVPAVTKSPEKPKG